MPRTGIYFDIEDYYRTAFKTACAKRRLSQKEVLTSLIKGFLFGHKEVKKNAKRKKV